VKFVQPVISKVEAKEIFSRKRTLLRRKKGEIVRIELINFPCYIFEVTAKTKKGEKKNYISVDGIKGSFSFFNLENVTFSEVGNTSFDFEITNKEARKTAEDEYRGEILRAGLIAKTSAELKEISEGEKIYYPYWVCYYKKRDKYNFQVIDGVNGRTGSVKMNPVFLKAFHQKRESAQCMS
jgi:hypothetical protein